MSALNDILVADFSRVLAGPFATMMLADLGATVVKVESPAGDDSRAWGPPFVEGQSTYFRAVNRNKRAIVLDLTTERGRSAACALARRADVLVHNFRAGGAERFGLGYERVKELNPRIVYCSITGFGRGRGASLAGYDFIVQAVGGLMSITGDPGGQPMKVGVALVDVLAGQYALAGILAALHARSRSGTGQWVEVNLLSALLGSLANQASAYLGGGAIPARMSNRHPSIAPYETLSAADGPIAVAVGNDRQFKVLCATLGAPELASDVRFATNAARVAHREELAQALESLLARDSSAHWIEKFHGAGIPAGRINDVAEAITYAEQLGLRPVVEVQDPETGRCSREIANPLAMSATPPSYRFPARPLGADTDLVLQRLASDDDLGDL